MQTARMLSLVLVLNLVPSSRAQSEPVAAMKLLPNRLTKSERAAGWRLLWDGKTTDGWHGIKAATFPTNGWSIANGQLIVHETNSRTGGGGNIITRERFSNFELCVDFKLTPGANSGIKYLVQSRLDPSDPGSGPVVGCEFQILDDERHPDARLGHDGNRRLGSLYDLIPAAPSKKTKPIGEWNTARIIVDGSRVEHWLNGTKILAYERSSAAFQALVAGSKFNHIPEFGQWPDGHILLQEHGTRVYFRNLKIRALSPGLN